MLLDKVQQANKGAEQEPYISSALDCTQCPGKSAIQPRLEPQFTVQSLSGRARAQCFLKKKMFVAGNDISAKEQYTKVTRSRGMRLAKNWNAKTNGCR